MKLTNTGLLLMLLAIAISCAQNDEVSVESGTNEFQPIIESKIDYSQINVLNKGFAGARGGEQLLVFPDKEAFIQTINELARQVDELDDAFIEFYKDLDEDALNDKEQEIGFNEEKPLTDFLEYMGFASLYQQIEIEETKWLQQEELDFTNDPNDHFIDGENYRVVLNADAEVQVGESIYKITEDGFFEITDGDLESLKILDAVSNGRISLPENVIFVGNDYNSAARVTASECKSSKSSSGEVTASQYERRIKWKVKHSTPLFGNRQVYAETTNYKKGGLFGNDWVQYRTYCEAMVYGFVSGLDGECDTQVDFNYNQWVWAVEYDKKSVCHKIFVSTKTRPGWVKGYHYGAGGREKASVLTW
ncbi:MAG: hypothetical protein RIE86_01145 [Imperialibacter sp.]|uniref:hypothetical protein n=1 Tax=Imperialibacter sp. TaxID=2038411 RepID=UPI0032EFF850